MSVPRRLDIAAFGEGLPELLSFGNVRAHSGGVNSLGVVKITDGAKAHLTASVPAAKICVTADMLAAKALANRLSGYCDGRVVVLPPRDDVLVYRRGFSAAHFFMAILSARLIYNRPTCHIHKTTQDMAELTCKRRCI